MHMVQVFTSSSIAPKTKVGSQTYPVYKKIVLTLK